MGAVTGGLSISAVVPTVGRSELLEDCLRALRREGGEALEIVVVDQGPEAVCLPAGLVDQVLRLPANEGFAGGTNRGLEAASGELLATVNDDLVVEPGWLEALTMALRAAPGSAAAQGVVLSGDGESVDGCGLAWNRRWQAVQLLHGEPAERAPGPDEAPREVFGVSATAALYRRSALEAVAHGAVFDPRLGSYYEDVDLAGRLRAAGFSALLVPAARARHAGSTTGRALGIARLRWIYGNRYLVLARLLGRGFWWRLPGLVGRDLLELVKALLGGRISTAAGILAGFSRALRHLPAYLHGGPARLSAETLSSFREVG